jgi:HK97 family phage major capsid protein
MFKDYLKKVIAAKEARAAELRKLIKQADTADEVRSLGETLQAILDELSDAKEQLDAAEEDKGEEKEPVPAPDEREQVPAGAELRGGNPLAAYGQHRAPAQRAGSILDTMEYRNAFAAYVRTGDESQFAALESRADATLITTDVGKIIPNTIMQEFIKDLKVYGNLYNRVRKLNVKGGVEFPIESLVPTVSWITETTVSDTQKAPELKTSVSFGYHICEARIAQSLLSQVVTLDILESEIARLLAEAFVKEFDRIIINGTGSGQPTGILTDTRVAATHKVAFTAAELADWTKWRTKLFAKIPLAYRGEGVLIMTAATWETYIMTMKDDNNRPLYVETYDPTNGNLTCRFGGREVILVEPDILKDFDTASTGDAWAIYLKPTDYAINSNLQIGFKRWFDDDKNRYVNKGLCIMDGKLLDVNGVFILKK